MIYYRHFGKALKTEVFNALVVDLMKDAFIKSIDKVNYHDYYKYRISYITETKLQVIFLFVTGLTDNFDNIKKELIKCKKEFLNLFEDIIKHRYDDKTFEVFDPTIDAIHKNLRPKISLVGFSGVGKTTITRLIKAEEIPMQHIPTITGDIATIKIGKLHFHLWDFAGQEQFSYLWNNFIKGSDAALLITDSSLENVEKSKFFLELIKEQAPHAHTAIIGNKQDLKTAMKPDQIEKILGLKTYSMIAKDPVNRDKMITIIADILEMSAEVSPLLQPLLKRDTYIEEATKALENAEFEKAANIFEEISDLCIELGDDSLGREFFEKSQKIKSMLQQVSPPQPTSPAITEPQKAKPEEVLISTEKVATEPKPFEKPPPPPDLRKIPEEPIASEKPKVPEKSAELIKPKVQKEPVKIIEEESIPETPEKKAIPPPPPPKEPIAKPESLQKPESTPLKVGLNLNPEDFMVKERPKTITTVPKDARKKLTISPYAQVENQQVKKEPKAIAPTKLIKPKSIKQVMPPKLKLTPVPQKPLEIQPKTPVPVVPTKLVKLEKKPVTPPKKPVPDTPSITPQQKSEQIEPITTLNIQQKGDLEKSLMDLKIKKANISKMSLEFDMKELTGEITAKELENKKNKLREIEKNINSQIHELEELIKKFN
ncbi:MAG: ADP-ribosylation factor-like protein [Promethearchaeota archaeon]